MMKNVSFPNNETLILNPLIMTLKVYMDQNKTNYLDVDEGMSSDFIFLSV